MPCHLCVEEQDGITYHCRRNAFDPDCQNNEKVASDYISLCDKHFYLGGRPSRVNPS